VYAAVVISGGSLVWPNSRGEGRKVTLHGSLLIEQTGELIVEPFSTQFYVTELVQLKDNCLLQFPMIGTTAQPSIDDLVGAPDPSPRGNL
jgi:hypothetical protein